PLDPEPLSQFPNTPSPRSSLPTSTSKPNYKLLRPKPIPVTMIGLRLVAMVVLATAFMATLAHPAPDYALGLPKRQISGGPEVESNGAGMAGAACWKMSWWSAY
ncbi:hypothetical protein H4R33_007059, partial [Dimargaris cristalligena]